MFDFNNKDRYHVESDLSKIIKQKFAESRYGTVVVATSKEDLELINSLNLQEYISYEPFKNSQNVVVVSPRQVYTLDDVKGYKNIIFLHKYFNDEHLYFSQKLDVFESDKITKSDFVLSGDRMVFAKIYKLISSFSALKANDVLDLAEKLSIKDNSVSVSQIIFSICVFMELNFIEFDEVLNSMQMLKSKKSEITSSKFYQNVIGE